MKESPHLQTFPQLNAFHGKPGFISLIGHRGARGLMPENTIEGFEYILDNDIIAIEFDVLLTKDEIPVITHDFFLSKAITRNLDYIIFGNFDFFLQVFNILLENGWKFSQKNSGLIIGAYPGQTHVLPYPQTIKMIVLLNVN